jgi:hypothetical protein
LELVSSVHHGTVAEQVKVECTYVEAADLATLACLQHRLNELNQGVKIEIC